jgi:peptidoglycan hydrolase CwlO-like protein
LLAFLLFAVFGAPSAGADTQSQLSAAKDKLDSLESQINAENDQLDSLSSQLNAIAGKIDEEQGYYEHTQQSVTDTRNALDAARLRYESLRHRLDQRAADAYMEGPGTGLEVLLGASSLGDFSDRLQFLDSVTQHDSDLANNVQTLANQLHQRETVLNKVLEKQASVIRAYNDARAQLDARFSQIQSIKDDLAQKQNEVTALVDKLGNKLAKEKRAALLALASQSGGGIVNIGDNPLHTCPVGDPMAFGDSFGAPRYAGGYHPHAGNDLMAPRGTPVYAPFDGVAEPDPNGLGGNAFLLHGASGYVYGAHLDSYGTMGSVSAGTVIGYVGDSGDALGGPTHLHFEWHPNVIPANPFTSSYGYTVIGSAIDPYPYLIQVC